MAMSPQFGPDEAVGDLVVEGDEVVDRGERMQRPHSWRTVETLLREHGLAVRLGHTVQTLVNGGGAHAQVGAVAGQLPVDPFEIGQGGRPVGSHRRDADDLILEDHGDAATADIEDRAQGGDDLPQPAIIIQRSLRSGRGDEYARIRAEVGHLGEVCAGPRCQVSTGQKIVHEVTADPVALGHVELLGLEIGDGPDGAADLDDAHNVDGDVQSLVAGFPLGIRGVDDRLP